MEVSFALIEPRVIKHIHLHNDPTQGIKKQYNKTIQASQNVSLPAGKLNIEKIECAHKTEDVK